MKKLLCIDFQVAAVHREQRMTTNVMYFNRMHCNLIDGNFEGYNHDEYVAKMRDLFKSILRDVRALSTIYAKYYGRVDSDLCTIVDREIESNSRWINKFIDRYSRVKNWRVIAGLKMPQMLTYCD